MPNNQQQNQIKILNIINQLSTSYNQAVQLGLPDKYNKSIYRLVNSIITILKRLL